MYYSGKTNVIVNIKYYLFLQVLSFWSIQHFWLLKFFRAWNVYISTYAFLSILIVYLAFCLVPFVIWPTFSTETLPSNGAQLLNQFKLGNKVGFQYQQFTTRKMPASGNQTIKFRFMPEGSNFRIRNLNQNKHEHKVLSSILGFSTMTWSFRNKMVKNFSENLEATKTFISQRTCTYV